MPFVDAWRRARRQRPPTADRCRDRKGRPGSGTHRPASRSPAGSPQPGGTGIRRHAMQDGELIAAGGARRVEGRGHVAQHAHAGRDDERTSRRREPAIKPEVGDVSARHLVGVEPDLGRARARRLRQTASSSPPDRDDGRASTITRCASRSSSKVGEEVSGATRPARAQAPGTSGRHQAIGVERLQLHGAGAGFGRRLHELECARRRDPP